MLTEGNNKEWETTVQNKIQGVQERAPSWPSKDDFQSFL